MNVEAPEVVSIAQADDTVTLTLDQDVQAGFANPSLWVFTAHGIPDELNYSVPADNQAQFLIGTGVLQTQVQYSGGPGIPGSLIGVNGIHVQPFTLPMPFPP